MKVNHSNFSTSADGADIFIVDSASSPFTNFGKLSTSGGYSSPIRAAGDGVTISNKGTLATTGDGSPGVAVGELFGASYDNVTVVNYGTISTIGFVFDDGASLGFSGGIEFYSGDHQTGINFGTIISSVEGIGLVGSDSTLLNYGTIESLSAGFYVEGAPFLDEGSGLERATHDAAINYGIIHIAAQSEFAWGIAFFADESVVSNYGMIQVEGFHDFGIAIEGAGTHGENYGTILSTGEQGRGVLLNFYDNSFVNRGTIEATGDFSVGFRWAVGEVDPATNGGSLTNFGLVKSVGFAVLGNEQMNLVINHGKFEGDVSLEEANDTYVAGKGGSLNGELTLGDGDDLIIFEKGGGKLTVDDFVPGAGTDDVIDVSAFGYGSFSEVMSNASQSGSDVILKLGAKDQITLQNVTLTDLYADDFVLGGLTGYTLSLAHDGLFGMA